MTAKNSNYEAYIQDLLKSSSKEEFINSLSTIVRSDNIPDSFKNQLAIRIINERDDLVSALAFYNCIVNNDIVDIISYSNALRIDGNALPAFIIAKQAIEQTKADGNFVIDACVAAILAAADIGLKKEISEILSLADSLILSPGSINEKRSRWLIDMLQARGLISDSLVYRNFA